MATNFTNIEEGDALASATLNTKFNGVKTEINALDSSSVRRNSLHHAHLPSMVTGTGSQTVGAALHTYDNIYQGYGNTTILASGTRTGAGWSIVHDGTNELTAVLSAAVNLSTARGLLIMANIEIWDIDDAASGTQSSLIYGLFQIQYRGTSGTWYHVPRSERFTHGERRTGTGGTQDLVQKDLSIRTFITRADLVGSVDRVRLLVACSRANVGLGGNCRVVLNRGNISAIGLHAGGS